MRTLSIVPKGIWRDTYVYQDGRVLKTDWFDNKIQDGAAKIAARLIGASVAGQDAPTNGFCYLALGEGDAAWDITPPTIADSDTTLTSEIDRIAINPSTDIVFLDPDTELVSGSPTRMVEITVIIDWERGLGDLREFGLVVGDATSVADTGELFNHVVHSLITKESAPNPLRIIRTLRIKWLISDEVTVL